MPHRRAPPRRHVPPSAVSSFLDAARITASLGDWVRDDADREFIVRCVIGEGPAHHRGANYVLLRLLDVVRTRLDGAATTTLGATMPVPMRLPPHLETEVAHPTYPLGLSVDAIERLAPRGSPDFDAMVDCVTDGPPQHALANVLMINLLETILKTLETTER